MRHRDIPGRVLLTLVILGAVLIPVTGISGPAAPQAAAMGNQAAHASHPPTDHSPKARIGRFFHSLPRRLRHLVWFFRDLGRSFKQRDHSQVLNLIKQTPPGQLLILTADRSPDQASSYVLIHQVMHWLPRAARDAPGAGKVVTGVLFVEVLPGLPHDPTNTRSYLIPDITDSAAWEKVGNGLAKDSKFYATRNPSVISRLVRGGPVVVEGVPRQTAIALVATAPVNTRVEIDSITPNKTGIDSVTPDKTSVGAFLGVDTLAVEKDRKENTIALPSGLFTSRRRNARIKEALNLSDHYLYEVRLLPSMDRLHRETPT